ncbi:MAG: ribulose-phosphate 3-epimerase [Candidatus Dasytiphilus stammeri]
MKQFLLASSILSANFAKLGDEITKVLSAGVNIIHLDVMDNHYVPNLTIGPIILNSLIEYGGLNASLFEVHLMVKPINSLIKEFAKLGVSIISFHPETSEHIDNSLDLIKEYGCKAGLVLNPNTPISSIEKFIHKIDVILLMSVKPGFGGQSFIPSTLLKIRQMRHIIDYNGYNIHLEIDGGIKINNIYEIARAGADIFVIGSAIFNQSESDYKQVINSIHNEFKKCNDFQ